MVAWPMTSRDLRRCREAVRSAILATAWLLVIFCIHASFLSLNIFYFVNVFLFEKAFIDNSIKKFEKHFCNHINELTGLDFIVKLAGCRALLYVRQCVLRIATRLLWRHAVGLGGVRTWSRELLRIKQSYPCLSLVLAIHASTALGITQEVEQFSRPDLEINRVDRLSRIDHSLDQTFTTVAYIALI